MPLGGENVGTAYVRIIANGSDLSDSIKDEIGNAEDGIVQAGEDSSKDYKKGWKKGFKDDEEMSSAIEKALARGSGKFDRIGDLFANGLADNFRDTIRERFGGQDNTIADTISTNLLGDFQRSGNYKKLIAALRDLPVEVDRAVRQIQQSEAEQDKRALDTSNKMLNEAYAMNAKFTKDRKRAIAQVRADFRDLLIDIERVEKGTDKLARGTRGRLIGSLHKLGDEMGVLGLRTHEVNLELIDHERRLRNTHPALSRSIRLTDDMANGIGRLFGGGSRNNFLNIFGKAIGGFAGLLSAPLKGFEALLSVGSQFKIAYGEGGVLGVVKLVSTSFLGLVGAGAGLAFVLGGVVVIVGVLTSALLSLVGAAVALAGSLAFALGGAIAVVAGALVPLIAGIGVGVLAFKNMDKESKKAFKGIGKAFKDLGKDAAKNIFDSPQKDAEAFRKTVESLSKITGPVSKALGGLLDEFIASLDSPLIKNFVNFLGRVLPGMVTSLGHIFGNLGEAFIGIFRAIAPFVQQFLNKLGQVTQDFADWANSVEGKHQIRDFMREARDSAQAVSDALGEVIGLIADLLGVSKDTGDNLFTRLANEVGRWRQALKDAEKDGVLRKWFQDAGDTAAAIGTMVTELGRFIDKLDTPENRKMVRDLAEAFIKVVGAISFALPYLEAFFVYFAAPVINAVKAIGKIKAAFHDLGGTFRVVYNAVIGPVLSLFLHAIGFLLRTLGNLFDILGSIPGAPKWIGETAKQLQGAADKTDTLANAIRNIPDAQVQVQGPSQATINKIEDQLGGLTRPRTVTIHANLTGYPGPSTGGQDTTPRVVIGSAPVTRYTAPAGSAQAPGKTVNANGWQIVTPTSDPKAVAAEVVNRLAGAGYGG